VNALIYVYLVIMTLIGAFAAFSLKKAVRADGFRLLLNNINLYIGGSLYFISALINVYVLKFLPYSVVLPMTSITYIWTMILAFVLLKEQISTKKIIGLALIIIGAIALPFSR
jgi:drug/metabolite transporter (DMT)-like permease